MQNVEAVDVEDVRREVAGHSWFHSIDLGNGIVTAGVDNTPAKLESLRIPGRLDGLSVLDIGAWDGFFSFEAERRGAQRVLATDHFCWQYQKAGFDIAKRILKSRIDEKMIAIEDLSPATVGQFDMVLFLGVLYHAQDPMHYLRIVKSVCKGRLILETLTDGNDYPRPAMVFYPGTTENNDSSNYWGPNRLATEAMLREVGFKDVVSYPGFIENRLVCHASV